MSDRADRRRRSNVRQYSAEDQALNQISKEADLRLQAKRAARAEAREIRLKEIEKQQKEAEERQDRLHGLSTDAKTRQLSGSRRNSTDSMESMESNRDRERDLKVELRELEDKYKQAMMTSATLDNEKQTLVYQLELLKDQIEEMEESHIELQREHKDRCRELEMKKRAYSELEAETKILKEHMVLKDKLIEESGFVIMSTENGEYKLEKNTSLSNGPVPTGGSVLLSAESIAMLNEAGDGSLGTATSHHLRSSEPVHETKPAIVGKIPNIEPETPKREHSREGVERYLQGSPNDDDDKVNNLRASQSDSGSLLAPEFVTKSPVEIKGGVDCEKVDEWVQMDINEKNELLKIVDDNPSTVAVNESYGEVQDEVLGSLKDEDEVESNSVSVTVVSEKEKTAMGNFQAKEKQEACAETENSEKEILEFCRDGAKDSGESIAGKDNNNSDRSDVYVIEQSRVESQEPLSGLVLNLVKERPDELPRDDSGIFSPYDTTDSHVGFTSDFDVKIAEHELVTDEEGDEFFDAVSTPSPFFHDKNATNYDVKDGEMKVLTKFEVKDGKSTTFVFDADAEGSRFEMDSNAVESSEVDPVDKCNGEEVYTYQNSDEKTQTMEDAVITEIGVDEGTTHLLGDMHDNYEAIEDGSSVDPIGFKSLSLCKKVDNEEEKKWRQESFMSDVEGDTVGKNMSETEHKDRIEDDKYAEVLEGQMVEDNADSEHSDLELHAEDVRSQKEQESDEIKLQVSDAKQICQDDGINVHVEYQNTQAVAHSTFKGKSEMSDEQTKDEVTNDTQEVIPTKEEVDETKAPKDIKKCEVNTAYNFQEGSQAVKEFFDLPEKKIKDIDSADDVEVAKYNNEESTTPESVVDLAKNVIKPEGQDNTEGRKGNMASGNNVDDVKDEVVLVSEDLVEGGGCLKTLKEREIGMLETTGIEIVFSNNKCPEENVEEKVGDIPATKVIEHLEDQKDNNSFKETDTVKESNEIKCDFVPKETLANEKENIETICMKDSEQKEKGMVEEIKSESVDNEKDVAEIHNTIQESHAITEPKVIDSEDSKADGKYPRADDSDDEVFVKEKIVSDPESPLPSPVKKTGSFMRSEGETSEDDLLNDAYSFDDISEALEDAEKENPTSEESTKDDTSPTADTPMIVFEKPQADSAVLADKEGDGQGSVSAESGMDVQIDPMSDDSGSTGSTEAAAAPRSPKEGKKEKGKRFGKFFKHIFK